jgi:hypothetical protein
MPRAPLSLADRAVQAAENYTRIAGPRYSAMVRPAILALLPFVPACLQLGAATQDAGAPRGKDAATVVEATSAACTLVGSSCTSSDPDIDCYPLTAKIYDGTLHCLGRLTAVACCAAPSVDRTGVPAQMACTSAERTGCIVATLASGDLVALYTPEIWLDPPSGFTACDTAAARDITTVAACTQ